MSKKLKGGNLRVSTLYLIILVVCLLLQPVIPDILLPFIAIITFMIARRKNWLKPFDKLDFLLIFLYTIITFVALIYLQAITLVATPWWKIILLGIAADVVASILGAIPIVGDFISAIINTFVAILVVGGPQGILLGLTLMFISLIPGPSMGANTLMLVILKFLSKALIGG
jgi:hypothetical protein